MTQHFAGDETWTIRIVLGPVLEQFLCNLFRIEDNDILSQQPIRNQVAWTDIRVSRGRIPGHVQVVTYRMFFPTRYM